MKSLLCAKVNSGRVWAQINAVMSGALCRRQKASFSTGLLLCGCGSPGSGFFCFVPPPPPAQVWSFFIFYTLFLITKGEHGFWILPAWGKERERERGVGGCRGLHILKFMRDVLDFTTGWRKAEGICRVVWQRARSFSVMDAHRKKKVPQYRIHGARLEKWKKKKIKFSKLRWWLLLFLFNA